MWSLDDKTLFSQMVVGALRSAGVQENELAMVKDAAIAEFNPNENDTAIAEVVRFSAFMADYKVPRVEIPEPNRMQVTLTVPLANNGASVSIALDMYFPPSNIAGESIEYPQDYIDLCAGNLLMKAIGVSKHMRKIAPMLIDKPQDTQSMPANGANHPNKVVKGNVNDIVNETKKVTKLTVAKSRNGNRIVRRLHGDWFSEYGVYLNDKCNIDGKFLWILEVDEGEYDINATVIVRKDGDKTSIISVQ